MTVTRDILIALNAHLAQTPAPALPAISWPNVPFTRVEGVPYLEVDFVPILRRPVVIGPDPEQRLSGQYFITVRTPQSEGAGAGMIIADRLVRRFNGSSAIVATNVTVRIEYSEVKMPLQDPPFYAIPVEIGWYAYKRQETI